MNVLSSSKSLEATELESLDRSNRLIKLDYPYYPRRRAWNVSKSKIFDLIDAQVDHYATLVNQFGAFSSQFEKIPVHEKSAHSLSPNWLNGWFPGFDAISLYGLLAVHNPRRYVEVGSGNSTKFARQAIKDHGLRTLITSIDPFPRSEIDSICDQVIRQSFEDVSSEFFESLTSEDILFVDNSHRSFPNSDVTVFFTEILPYLPSGMIYGLHDIFLPWDYPDEWKDRYYNEQYLLAAYLQGGGNGDAIILPNTFISYFSPHLLNPLDSTLNNHQLIGIEKTGSAFWLRRG
jgi:Methyltransferase domain